MSSFFSTQLPSSLLRRVLSKTDLSKVNWSEPDVLIGTLRSRKQLQICLHHRFYHIPALQLQGCDFPIRHVAIYQSKTLFGDQGGVRYYGAVAKCTPVLRSQITEIPARPGSENVLYYRFEIKKWECLRRPILAKEMGFVRCFTNLFLLKSSTEIPELFLRSAAEYRLYTRLKELCRRASHRTSRRPLQFRAEEGTLTILEGQILVFRDNRILGKYAVSDFTKRPYAVFQQIWNVLRQSDF